nr:unnamed protein product [Digitaria exilis]
MASPHMAMAIFFFALLASSSPCLARARLMILSDHQAQLNSMSSSGTISDTTTSAEQQVVQGVAVSSPAVTTAAGEVDHPESTGWMPDGSVPSPGVGHHP